ncbi:hypothetical protein [Hoeflea alexandrii]
MNTSFLIAAAIASVLTALAHIVIGGRKNAAPVLQSPGLEAGPKTTVTLAWHAVSIFLLAVAAIFLFAAATGDSRLLVQVTTLHCGVLTGLSAAMALRGGLNPLTFPPAFLFAMISICGCLALWL